MADRPWNRSPEDGDSDREPVTLGDWLRSLRRRYGTLRRPLGIAAVTVVGLVVVAAVGWLLLTTFVLGGGCLQPGPPAAAVETGHQGGTLTIRHDGGDAFTSHTVERVEVLVDGRLVASPLLPFEDGDRITVHDVPRGSRIRIVAVLSEEYREATCSSSKREVIAAFGI